MFGDCSHNLSPNWRSKNKFTGAETSSASSAKISASSSAITSSARCGEEESIFFIKLELK